MARLNVLLVEDHRELAETTGAYLEACGYSWTTPPTDWWLCISR